MDLIHHASAKSSVEGIFKLRVAYYTHLGLHVETYDLGLQTGKVYKYLNHKGQY